MHEIIAEKFHSDFHGFSVYAEALCALVDNGIIDHDEAREAMGLQRTASE